MKRLNKKGSNGIFLTAFLLFCCGCSQNNPGEPADLKEKQAITEEVQQVQKKELPKELSNLIRDINKDILTIKDKHLLLKQYNGKVSDYGLSYNPPWRVEDNLPQQPDHLGIYVVQKSTIKKGSKYYNEFENIKECQFEELDYCIAGSIKLWDKSDKDCAEVIKIIVIDNCKKVKEEISKVPHIK